MLSLTEKQKSIFDVLAEGILIIDAEGKVVFANEAYRSFLKMEQHEIEGRILRDFRPHAQLPSVVASGKPVLHAQRLEGLEEAYFVNMYPLREKGEIVGGISVITFMSEAEKARNELEKYEARMRQQVLRQANKNAATYTFDSISELIIYRWNRNYPHDFDFDINITESNFKIASTDEFRGSSHEKITKEVYLK